MFFENETDKILKKMFSDPFFGFENSLGTACGSSRCGTEADRGCDDCGTGSAHTPGLLYYGLVMTTGPDGLPIIREYGNAKPDAQQTRRNTNSPGTKEPLTDTIVDEKAKTIKVIAEIPGVEKRDIKVTAGKRHVRISAVTGNTGRMYDVNIPLECQTNPNSAKATYRNGILQITFNMVEDAHNGRTIRVD